MTKAEVRVAIAKDVLKHLNKLRVKVGQYISLYYKVSDENAQKSIDKITRNCEVCALGACLLSHVRLFDKMTIREVYLTGRPTKQLRNISH